MSKESPIQLSQTANKPFYLRAAEIRAAQLGLTTEELLRRYSKEIEESKYPTRDCLTVDRVQDYAWGSTLSDAERQHVTECEDCRLLLDAAHPSEERVQSFLAEIRLLAVKAAAHAVGKRNPGR